MYHPYQPTTDFGRALWGGYDGLLALLDKFFRFIGWLYTLTPEDWSPEARLMVYPAAYAVLVIVTWPIRNRHRLRRNKSPLGKAVFASLWNVFRDGLLWPGGRFLGRYPLLSGLSGFDLSMHGEGHCLTIAAQGGGKTAGLIIPTLLTYRAGSVIVTDPKGAITAQTSRHRSTMGRVVVLNPWRDELRNDPSFAVDLGDDGFNPCQLVGVDENGRAAAALLASLILPNDSRSPGDDFWKQEARELLEWGLLFLAMILPDQLTLPGLRGFLYDVPKLREAFRAIAASTHQGPGWSALREGAAKFIGILADGPAQLAGVVGTATGALKIYNAETQLGRHVSRGDGFRLADLKGDEKLTLYLICPPDHLIRDDVRWLNLMMAMMAQQVGKPGYAREIVLLLDEFPALGHLPGLLPALEQFREAGLRAHLIAQNPGQIMQTYGSEGLTRLWGVAETKQFFRFTDPVQARHVSDWMGQITVHSVTRNARGEESVSTIGVPLVRPEELLKMKRNRQIIFRPGMPPIRARVVPYFKRPEWRRLVDANPYRRKPGAAGTGHAGAARPAE